MIGNVIITGSLTFCAKANTFLQVRRPALNETLLKILMKIFWVALERNFWYWSEEIWLGRVNSQLHFTFTSAGKLVLGLSYSKWNTMDRYSIGTVAALI